MELAMVNHGRFIVIIVFLLFGRTASLIVFQ